MSRTQIASARAIRLSMLAAVAGTAFVAAPAAAEPDDADLNNWKGPCYNCFNYAVNSKDVFFAQLTPPFTCDNMRTQVLAAGLTAVDWDEGDPIPMCEDGCLVALVADIDNPNAAFHDFHWYRLNDDGNWSHKQGQLPATERGGGGQAPGTWNPTQAAARGSYETFCGFFCIPSEPMLMLNGVPAWANVQGAGTVRPMDRSGPEEPGVTLDPLQLKELLPLLPPGLPVPDPQWAPDTFFDGVSLQPNPDLFPSLPPYITVSDGVVALYFGIDDPFVEIQYFADENGLEPALRGILGGTEPCSPADLAPPFGVLDLADVNTFIDGFVSNTSAGDVAPPFGVWDLADINTFIALFLDGCP